MARRTAVATPSIRCSAPTPGRDIHGGGRPRAVRDPDAVCSVIGDTPLGTALGLVAGAGGLGRGAAWVRLGRACRGHDGPQAAVQDLPLTVGLAGRGVAGEGVDGVAGDGELA